MLSVPMLIIQADGVCFDKFYKHNWIKSADLYGRDFGSLPKTQKNKVTGPFIAILEEANKLTQGNNPPPLSTNLPLCRHHVLHGCDTDYDKEENSLRAIAVLDFAMWLGEVSDGVDKAMADRKKATPKDKDD